MRNILKLLIPALMLFIPVYALANGTSQVPVIGGIRAEFIIFALTLVCVALFHNYTMWVALSGLTIILIFKFSFDADFNLANHFIYGREIHGSHHEGEWRILLNLIGLLFGFGILAKHFEESKVPDRLPNILPDDWKGGLVLLFLIMILSSFLDNIAAAMIGGTIALVVFKNKVHVGYVAAIVAASNAGGAGSVVGDTTTTMMWIAGVSPLLVIPAFIASAVAFLFFGFVGSMQQHKFQPITKDADPNVKINYTKLVVVFMILVGAILTNYLLDFPAAGVWAAIIIGAFITSTPWEEIKNSFQGTIFLTALVSCASMMPVDELPSASWQTALSLGFISAVFDNIPLTALCINQDGYDWGMLAYAVGFGGSMIWFGSSAGVAISGKFPEARSVVEYVKKGWHVAVAYVLGFFALYLIMGWNPTQIKGKAGDKTPAEQHDHTEGEEHQHTH